MQPARQLPTTSTPVMTTGRVALLFHPQLTFQVQSYQTYLLRVGGFGGDQGTGRLQPDRDRASNSPINDNCTEPDSALHSLQDEITNTFETFFAGTTVNGTFDSDGYVLPQCLY